MLVQKDGKWALVSRKTRRPLAYYKGEGKPPEEWVAKQERRVQYFKHLGESLEDFYSKKNPPPMFHVVRNYYHLTDKGHKEHEIINYFNKTFGMKLKKGDIETHIRKNLHSFKEDVFGISKKLSPILHHGEYKIAHQTLKNVMQRKKQEGSKKDVTYYASRVAQSHPNVDVKKLVKMYKEEYGAGEDGTDELRKKYQKDTPGQKVMSFTDYTKTK